MWNDTNSPLAYLVTIRTHGTWLHGDERGSVSRHKNKFNSPKLGHEPAWLETNRSRLRGGPVILNSEQRVCVRESIQETCRFRRWSLLVVNVRTNHGHAVVSAAVKPDIVLNALKANATRQLRESSLWLSEHSPWADKGSTKYLWNAQSVGNACAYVEYEQGEPLRD